MAFATALLVAASFAHAQPSPERPLIAVLNLEPVGATDVEASALSDRLREELLRSGRFSLVERERLESVLEEQTIQQAGCQGKECVLQVGRVLGVSMIVTGRATKLGANSWQVSAQLIDVATAETKRAESVLFEGRLVDLLQQGVPNLAQKLTSQDIGAALTPAPTPQPVPPLAEPEPLAKAEEPPPEDAAEGASAVRLWLSPLTPYSMGLTLTYGSTTVNETIGGVGASLGLDMIITDDVAVWFATHFGTVTSWSVEANSTSTTLEEVDGSFATISIGLDAVFAGGGWRMLLGGGLFTSSAEFSGFSPELGASFDSDATVSGILFNLRGDYTFEGGFLVGAGLDLGFGSASGTETQGADSASGTILQIYFPIGFSF